MDFLNVLLNIPDEMERSLNVPARAYVTDTKAMAGTPVDVKEFPNKYLFIADMPGLKSSDIKVQIENENVLSITAERKREEDEGKFLRMERRVGKFMRKFTLPGDADLEKVGASCVEGILTVTVPKIPPPEPQKPKLITVTGQ